MICDSLAKQFSSRGHQVDLVYIPLTSYWRDLPAQTLAIRNLDLSAAAGSPIDRLITIRYPSYALPHPNKVAWFIHHHRGAYDLWGTRFQDIPNTPEGLEFRQALIQSDTKYLREARKIFTNSKTVAGRLEEFNAINADGILYPPHPNPDLFYNGESGNYFLYASRLTPIKRQNVAIEAMRYVKSNFKLLLIGAPDLDSYKDELENMVAKWELHDKVRLLGWIPEGEKATLTANCYAAIYIPYNEDSYGYSTLEAFHSKKPVITFQDSGGTNEIIRHGFNGFVCDSSAEALAASMDKLWVDKNQIYELGNNAFKTLDLHNIHWDHVIEGLLG